MPTGDIVLVYLTVPETHAGPIAGLLVESGLVACVNRLDGVQSTFMWQGSRSDERESLLLCKTTRDRAAEAVAAARSLHPYEVPCVTAFEVTAGHGPFLQWVRETVGASRGPAAKERQNEKENSPSP